ncbi:MAG: hypothetical protein ACYTGQ_10410, partial [Planctomycetota bacterium]
MFIQVGLGSREPIDFDTELIHDRQEEIAEKARVGRFSIDPLMGAVAKTATHKDRGQVRVVVRVRIAHAAPIQHGGAVKQRPPARVPVQLQLVKEARQPLHVFDPHQVVFGDFRGIVAVVRKAVITGTQFPPVD